MCGRGVHLMSPSLPYMSRKCRQSAVDTTSQKSLSVGAASHLPRLQSNHYISKHCGLVRSCVP